MQPGQAVLLHPSRIFTWQEFWHVSWKIGNGIGPWAEFKCGKTQSEVVPPRGADEGRSCFRGQAQKDAEEPEKCWIGRSSRLGTKHKAQAQSLGAKPFILGDGLGPKAGSGM